MHYHLMQVLTEHGNLGMYLHRLGREENESVIIARQQLAMPNTPC